jgi:lipopolysaccharide/colanic/teichoic acid biosynthesis glycosyltransferase
MIKTLGLFNAVMKRLFDILISFIVLVITLPLTFVISLIIKITMPGPILFRQKRTGYKGKEFIIYKFRSMKVDLDAEAKIDTSKDLDRTTKFGKFLRRVKLDEIPQFINVLFGTMSIIGPRPTIQRQVIKYTDHQMRRLDIKPGITGLAQVSGGVSIPWSERIEIDIKYIEEYNIFTDLRIILKTLRVVIFGK